MLDLRLTEYDRLVYEKELKDFLPEKIIDLHTHIGKASFNPLANRIPVRKTSKISWTALMPKELLAEDLLQGYQEMFPENKVTPLVFGDCTHDIHQVNNYVLETAKQYGFPTLYRSSYDMPVDELEEKVKKGGYLGLKPYLNQRPSYIPADETRIFDFLTREQLEAADHNGWIIMLHIPRSKRLRDQVNLAQLMEIEEKYPNLKLVVAHIGRAYAREDIGDAFEILKNTQNMMFDFTANLCDDAIQACIEAVGCKRLMFGSDLPVAFKRLYRIVENGNYINVIPEGYYGDISNMSHLRESKEKDITLMIYEQIRSFKRVAARLKLSDQDIEDVFFANASGLLGNKAVFK